MNFSNKTKTMPIKEDETGEVKSIEINGFRETIIDLIYYILSNVSE